MSNIQDLLELSAAASLEKQMALGDLIGEADWSADLDTGTITFGSRYQFPIQVLGTESEQSATWLWAWANTASNIPPQLLNCANNLKAFGTREAIPELTTPNIPLKQIDGHRLAMIASGLCRAACYYRGPYQGGAVFLLISDAPQVQAHIASTPVQVINVFTQLIQAIPLNHRRALEAYLKYKGYSCKATGTGFEATNAKGQTIYAAFDIANRLIKLDTKM